VYIFGRKNINNVHNFFKEDIKVLPKDLPFILKGESWCFCRFNLEWDGWSWLW